MPDLSAQQSEALDRVRAWFLRHREGDESTPQVFRLFGYAGTGKTTIAHRILDGRINVMFAAYTGKAALVLNQKGCPATTIHSLIYRPAGEAREVERDAEGLPVLGSDGKVKFVDGGKRKLQFVLDLEGSPLNLADLLIVDEVSMVDKDLAEDLLSFKKPILVLGDPAQLPPVGGAGYFIKAQPDFLLTEVHRQAAGSPVLDLATTIRASGRYKRLEKMTLGMAAEFDQVIIGTNRTRWQVNNEMREHLKFPSGRPVPGDKIIVLQNNRDFNVVNGETFTIVDWSSRLREARVRDEASGIEMTLPMWPDCFTREGEQAFRDKHTYKIQQTRVQATFAQAITCHKSQGSQWGTVLVLDESRAFRGSEKRWLYTAVTRAVTDVRIVDEYGLYKPTIKPRPRRRVPSHTG